VSNSSDDANDEEVLELEYTVGVSGDHGPEDFQNDDDEQNVIDCLNHSVGKERPGCEHSNYTKDEGDNGDAKKKHA
jgi:hypothetical protein